jgi:hypothetical protein
MNCHYTFIKVNLLRDKEIILTTEEQKFQPVSFVDVLCGLLAGRSGV